MLIKNKILFLATEFILLSGNSVFVEGWGGREGDLDTLTMRRRAFFLEVWRRKWKRRRRQKGCLFCVCEMGKQLKRRWGKANCDHGLNGKKFWKIRRNKFQSSSFLWRGRLWCFPLDEDGEEEEESDIYIYRGNKINSKSPRGPLKNTSKHTLGFFQNYYYYWSKIAKEVSFFDAISSFGRGNYLWLERHTQVFKSKEFKFHQIL